MQTIHVDGDRRFLCDVETQHSFVCDIREIVDPHTNITRKMSPVLDLGPRRHDDNLISESKEGVSAYNVGPHEETWQLYRYYCQGYLTWEELCQVERNVKSGLD